MFYLFCVIPRQSNLSNSKSNQEAELDFRSFCIQLCSCLRASRLYIPQPQHFIVEKLLSMADALDFSCQLKCQTILNIRFEVLGRGKCHMTPAKLLQFMAERSGQMSANY